MKEPRNRVARLSRSPGRVRASLILAPAAAISFCFVLASCFDFGESPSRTPGGVKGVAITSPADTAHIAVGDSLRFVAEARDERGELVTGAVLVWSSSNHDVATIDTTGLARGLADGTSEIRASSGEVDSAPVTLRVGSGSAGPSLAATVQPIFTAHCAVSGCHVGPQPQESMNLEAGSAYGAIVNRRSIDFDIYWRVKPFDPDSSLIYVKVSPRCDTSCPTGARMPFSRPPLSDADIETIRLWIAGGARP